MYAPAGAEEHVPGRHLDRLLLASVISLAFLLEASRPVVTNDLSIYVAMGRWMLEHRALLDHDVFTWTVVGRPFLNGTWGFSLLAAASHALVGYEGLRLLNGLVVASTCLGLALLSERLGASRRAATLATLYAWLLLLQNMAPRGQTLCFPLFLTFFWILYRGVEDGPSSRPWGLGRVLASSTLLGALWGPLHGSFPVALALAGAWAVGLTLRRRSLRPALAPILATLGIALGVSLGPLGFDIWTYVHQNSTLPRGRDLLEWYAPAPLSFAGLRLGLAFGLWGLLVARRPRALPLEHLLAIVGFGAMAVSGTRFIAWFGLASALPLALRLGALGAGQPSPLLRRLLGTRRRAYLTMAAFSVFWILLLGRGVLGPLADGRPRPALSPDTPVATVEFLADRAPCGRLYAAFEHGGYIAERLGERISPGTSEEACFPVFLDMRVWIFEDDVWKRFIDIATAGPGWQEALEAEDVRYLLLSPDRQGSALLRQVRDSPRWKLLLDEGHAALFERREDVPGPPG